MPPDDFEEWLSDLTPEERKKFDDKVLRFDKTRTKRNNGGAPEDDAAQTIPPYSDEAIALSFAERHAADLRFVALWSKWLIWDGDRWRIDDTIVAFDRARALCREVAANYKDKRAATVASAKTVAAVATLARADRRHAATAEQWDARLTRLSMPTRTMDLETGLDHRPNPLDYSNRRTAATAAPEGAPCPLWIAFLRTVTGDDEELIGFLQRFLGYCLTGLTIEHSLLFLFGTGSNGKSVFTSVLTTIFGDYAIIAPMEMFIATMPSGTRPRSPGCAGRAW
jgi:putative DNA primase/helicase